MTFKPEKTAVKNQRSIDGFRDTILWGKKKSEGKESNDLAWGSKKIGGGV